MRDIKTNLTYISACLKPLAELSGVNVASLRRNLKANSPLNVAINDIKYCKGRFVVYEATLLKSRKGNNGKIKEINQARRDKGL